MPWEKVWKTENKYQDREITLEVFKNEQGQIEGAQILWDKNTDKRHFMDSMGISIEALTQLKSILSSSEVKA